MHRTDSTRCGVRVRVRVRVGVGVRVSGEANPNPNPNQATISNGELPHAADTVTAWPSHLRRVVIGINSMGHVEGPSECALPQHSKAFKRCADTVRVRVRARIRGRGRVRVR